MKQKKTFKQKLKAYFTETPPSDFWMWAFFMSVIFSYVGPLALFTIVPMQIGLLAPEQQIDFTNLSENLAENLVIPMNMSYNIGSDVAVNNKAVGWAMAEIIGYFVYVAWTGTFILVLQFSRYLISFIYKKINKN